MAVCLWQYWEVDEERSDAFNYIAKGVIILNFYFSDTFQAGGREDCLELGFYTTLK